jgi:hypothetical protein
MHLVITAKIHVFSSTSTVLPSAVFPEGGWKATLRPSCKGSCFASASLRAFGSRENGIASGGPADPRIEAVAVARCVPVTGGVTEVEVGDGDGGRGRLLRFSVVESCEYMSVPRGKTNLVAMFQTPFEVRSER